MRRGSSRREKKEKCSTNAKETEKIPTVNFTQSDPTPVVSSNGYKRYPSQFDATSGGGSAEKIRLKVATLQLKEKASLLNEAEEEEELLDYSPKEGDTIDTARLTYRIWGDGKLCENTRPYKEVKFCFICDTKSDDLRHGTRMHSEKLDENGQFYPIYRHVFMCKGCFEKNPREKKVFITEKAMKKYYSCKK